MNANGPTVDAPGDWKSDNVYLVEDESLTNRITNASHRHDAKRESR